MTFPVPKPGLVIRYAFLWSSERAAGATEGAKDRPCAIVVATRRDAAGDIRTIVAPVTHRPPDDPAASIEIPAATCRRLGLHSALDYLSPVEFEANPPQAAAQQPVALNQPNCP